METPPVAELFTRDRREGMLAQICHSDGLKTLRGIVATAIFRGDAVRIIYVTRTKVSLRTVVPYRWKSAFQFIALDLGKDSLRTFRIDHIMRIIRLRSDQVFPPFYPVEIDLKKGKLCPKKESK